MLELATSEVRPQPVEEDELGVGKLPEQEVRDAQLARGADQQVWVRQLGRIEVGAQGVLVDLGRLEPCLDEPACGLDELRAASVVERDPEVETLVLRRLLLEARHLLLQPGRSAVTAA